MSDQAAAAADPAAPNLSREEVGSAAAPAASSSPAALDPAYLEGLSVTGDDGPGYEAFGRALRADGVQASAGRAILGWIYAQRQRGSPPAEEPKQHGYDVDLERFEAEDRVAITSFMNHAAKNGLSQWEVDAALRIHAKVSAAVQREKMAEWQEAERMDEADADAALNWMRGEYGPEARANFQLLRAHVDRLPESERAALEAERDTTGLHALNNPIRIRELVAKARGGTETREQLEALMGNRESAYWRGPNAMRLQALYRDQLRGAPPQAKPLPADRAAVDKEIADIEKFMRTDRAAYYRDTAKQERLRALYAKRDGA